MVDERKRSSRLKTGTLKKSAVAPMIRSGRSGTWSRGTSIILAAMVSCSGTVRRTLAGSRETNLIAGRARLIDETGRSLSQARIGIEVPNDGRRVGYRDNHQKSARGKFANIPFRFASISAGEGAGPYFDSRPRNERVGCLSKTSAGTVAIIFSITSRTRSSEDNPFERAKAARSAS
jgi:hypothetical protein